MMHKRIINVHFAQTVVNSNIWQNAHEMCNQPADYVYGIT